VSGVFQNIDPPTPPLTARRVCYPPPSVRGEDALAGLRGGWGVNILEDARHSSILYICEYFVCGWIAINQICEEKMFACMPAKGVDQERGVYCSLGRSIVCPR
jgi:hypothetical protein